jgi:hypothetical protein
LAAVVHRLPQADLFTRAEALALGWSDSALTRAVRSGRLVRVRRGRFARHEPDAVTAGIAAARSCGASVMSHRSAALLHGMPLVGAGVFRPDLTLSPPSTGDTAHALVHRATLRPQDVVIIGESPVTSAARTVVDLGRSCPTLAAVAATDFALHEELTTREEIADVLDMCRRWPGIRRALRAVRLADARSESPLESASRLVIGSLRLPMPDLQPVILDAHGYPAGRLDFYWDDYGVGGEADGRSKYDGRLVLTKEKDRQEHLEDLRVAMTRWGWWHVTHPAALRTKIENAFARGRARDAAGLPRLWAVRPCPAAR